MLADCQASGIRGDILLFKLLCIFIISFRTQHVLGFLSRPVFQLNTLF